MEGAVSLAHDLEGDRFPHWDNGVGEVAAAGMEVTKRDETAVMRQLAQGRLLQQQQDQPPPPPPLRPYTYDDEPPSEPPSEPLSPPRRPAAPPAPPPPPPLPSIINHNNFIVNYSAPMCLASSNFGADVVHDSLLETDRERILSIKLHRFVPLDGPGGSTLVALEVYVYDENGESWLTISGSLFSRDAAPSLISTETIILHNQPLTAVTACCNARGTTGGLALHYANGTPSRPPPGLPSDIPLLPPLPSPPPPPTNTSILKDINTIRRLDVPQITAGVPNEIPNNFATAALVMWGAAVPIFVTESNSPAVIAGRYGKGRLAAFGAERMVTQCCTANNPNATTPSEPAMDRLILNTAVWAGHYGWKVRQ
ncbi:hypothetical protein VOLCADRAFT_101029 [Volvox carteri f. nagariensis]|uniref:Uncharacterized protein n=1 Tax=Volvox carteri f. nagariensis TaxID=3068 RepID=D8ULK5_VOLCA|nr:uncharacterized protein VOLCADRAFT_101029 [Volvox carteri f. nagariensis]EFJ39394.1 hypothetical protein VOLCADRAFT_101029 [Volvox carteri f. nagariensis]|eukprot:XP_002959541.1 hypothetical protein VOLCADRAFT_101029 [Volvox carteri f. nagariensis]